MKGRFRSGALAVRHGLLIGTEPRIRDFRERQGRAPGVVGFGLRNPDGSRQPSVGAFPDLFRTAWELPQRALIDMAAARAPYIDQSQSLNLFIAGPSIGKLSSMYLHAWKTGLKTTYYLRSRPATRIQQTTVGATPALGPVVSDAVDAVACSLENPESCEACQ